MNTLSRLAVCSWSLQPESLDDLVAKVRRTGVPAVQLALEPLIERPAAWIDTPGKLTAAGISIVSGMMGCVGEDYSTIAQIKATGGVMPDTTYPATLANMKAAAALARQLGLSLVTFHAGFIPHERSSPDFAKGVARVGEVAKVFAEQGIDVALETGQEPAAALVEFLEELDRKTPGAHAGVNFDPANLLLYGSGDPVEALKSLLPFLRQVHIKDAIASGRTGEWGEEVPAGQGQVDWPAFFLTLRAAGYGGKLVIEREAGTNRAHDIVVARELVLKLA